MGGCVREMQRPPFYSTSSLHVLDDFNKVVRELRDLAESKGEQLYMRTGQVFIYIYTYI